MGRRFGLRELRARGSRNVSPSAFSSMRSRRIVQRLPPRLRASHEKRPGRSCVISLRKCARVGFLVQLEGASPIWSLSKLSRMTSVLVAAESDRASSVMAAGRLIGMTRA